MRRAAALLLLSIANFTVGSMIAMVLWCILPIPRSLWHALYEADDRLAVVTSFVTGLIASWPVNMGWLGTALVDSLTGGNVGPAYGIVFLVATVAAPTLVAAPSLSADTPAARGRSLALSVAGAAIVGAACALGILLTAWDLFGLVVTESPRAPSDELRGGALVRDPWLLVLAWASAGALLAHLLRRAGCNRHPVGIDRFIRWIFAGTCVELAIAVPTYIAAKRRSDCACSWGSWWALVAGVATLGLMCGPALLLLATRRSRMQWIREACPACGYPRRGTPGTPCSECGALPRGRAADAAQ